jgi:hypothetical protein
MTGLLGPAATITWTLARCRHENLGIIEAAISSVGSEVGDRGSMPL